MCINFLAQSSAASCEVSVSIPLQSLWNLYWAEWNWDRFFFEYFWCSVVWIIRPLLLNHIRLNVVLTCGTSRRNLQSNVCYYRCGRASDGRVLLFLLIVFQGFVSWHISATLLCIRPFRTYILVWFRYVTMGNTRVDLRQFGAVIREPCLRLFIFFNVFHPEVL